MMLTQRDYGLFIETIITIFTIDNSILKVLLIRNEKEPYKGYWELPGDVIKNDESLENNITNVVYDKAGLTNLNIEQSGVFGAVERDHDNRMIAVSYMGMVDIVSAELKRVANNHIDVSWFSVDNLPKLAYDHEVIIKSSFFNLQNRINESVVLKAFYPSDFTLPEIQRTIENIYKDESFDRRNFRKKLLNLEIIEDTGLKTNGKNGRPAVLYKFKDEIDKIDVT